MTGIAADNTDAPALIDSLPFPANGRTALVLGAGGSARAAVWALLDAGAADVWVLNRTAARAQELCRQIGGTPVPDAAPADILVNCTPVGMDGTSEPPVHVTDYGCIVDFVYGAAETPLVEPPARPRSRRSTGSSCWSARARSASSSSPADPLLAR